MLDWLFGKKKEQPKQQKPKKSKKEAQAEDKWMYDFMTQFLSSPLWRVSILDFVDNKCIVFDNEQENKFEYTILHNDFKELVGNLVDGMMQEIGMSQQKLAQIIQKGMQSKEKKLYNQLLLADDFLRFKDLMVKRNKSLQQEAIKSMQEAQHGKSSSQPEEKVHRHKAQEQLFRESKRLEEERQKKLQQEEDEMLRKAIEQSRITSKESQAIRELEEKATDNVKEEPKVNVEEKNTSHEQQHASRVSTTTKQKTQRLQPLKGHQSTKPQLADLPPLKGTLNKNVENGENEFGEKQSQKVEHVKQQVKEQPKQQPKQQVKHQLQNQKESNPPAESMQDRKQRLLAQREKIRKQKQEHRRQQLEQQEHEAKDNKQPEVVHTVVLQEDGFYESTQPSAKKDLASIESNTVSQDELKRRKQLMNKIKNRIIDDF